jgi:hypothetical protein
VHAVEEESSQVDSIATDVSAGYFVIDSLTSEPACKEWFETFQVENIKLPFKLDTGASATYFQPALFSAFPRADDDFVRVPE